MVYGEILQQKPIANPKRMNGSNRIWNILTPSNTIPTPKVIKAQIIIKLLGVCCAPSSLTKSEIIEYSSAVYRGPNKTAKEKTIIPTLVGLIMVGYMGLFYNDVLPQSTVSTYKIWLNISTGNIDVSGTIHNCKCVAAITTKRFCLDLILYTT